MNLGYACINTELNTSKPRVTTNRGMIKRTFEEKGYDYCSQLALENVKDFKTILRWNIDNGIKLFRTSSDMIPWASEYLITVLKDYDEIYSILMQCGLLCESNNVRVTTHPGPFNVLCSPNNRVVDNTLAELSRHGQLFDMMGFRRTPYNKINIHCNGVYGDKIKAMERFCENFEKLPHSVTDRLTVENDDKESMYSVKDLMFIHDRIGIPIVFDYHHHKFNTGGLTEKEALQLAISTWPSDITPIVHYSESKSIHENNDKLKPQAHSDMINDLPDTYGYDVDVMVEAKSKEKAILPFVNHTCSYSGLRSVESYEIT